ncbi:MAG: hypothetical protein AAFN63_06235 [Pseudomonadota bacterium]
MTFGIVFLLTMLIAPFVVAGSQREEISGGVFVVFLVAAVTIAIPVFFKGVVVATFVFFPIYHLGAVVIGRPLAFVVGATVAASASASLALSVNVDLMPPNIAFIEDFWDFASVIGGLAAMIGLVVATIQVLVGGRYA